LSYALIWSGDTAEGRRQAEECLKRQPGSVPARRLLAQCDRDAGDFESALDNVRQVLAIAPEDLESRLLKAELLLFLKRGSEAWDVLESLPAGQQDQLRVLTLLERAATVTGRTAKAQEYQRRIQDTRETAPEQRE
jgi:predicted Zn-dependent protease